MARCKQQILIAHDRMFGCDTPFVSGNKRTSEDKEARGWRSSLWRKAVGRLKIIWQMSGSNAYIALLDTCRALTHSSI